MLEATRQCDQCGKAFQPARRWSRFCCEPCREEWWDLARAVGDRALTAILEARRKKES